MSMPRDFSPNKIGRVGITIVTGQGGPSSFLPLQENSLEFTGLAFSIHLGVSILEKPPGRRALWEVGMAAIGAWDERGDFRFEGDRTALSSYVDEFLRAVRDDFPRVLLRDMNNLDIIAESRRTPGWDGNLSRYEPKRAGGIYFNMFRVSQMARAAEQTGDRNPQKTKMTARYRMFLFMFAVATAHELTHLFIGYLARGHDTPDSYTPPGVTHLNYSGIRNRNRPGVPTGESGRWLENHLFGGAIEFYQDRSDDNGQAGLPYILDSNALARKIKSTCIISLVTNIQGFGIFPFATTGRALNDRDRQRKGLRSLGSTGATSSQQSGSFMRGRQEPSGPLYDISVAELALVPLQPTRRLSLIRVA